MSSNVVGIGEVLWDLLPSGALLGGAPANFAWHAHALGARVHLISRVGVDRLGKEIQMRLADMKLNDELVQIDDAHPTGTVTVTLTNGIPEYTIHQDVAWDNIAVTEKALTAMREAEAVCFGSLAQRNPVSRQAIQTLVSATRDNAFRIFDINLRQHYFDRAVLEASLQLANVLKLNDAELPVVANLFGIGGTVREQIECLAQQFGLRVVALTLGPRGSLLYRDGQWSEQGAVDADVKDTIGAGDAFTAALCLGLLRGLELDRINAAANKIAAFVCSCSGATPALPAELRRLIA